MNQRISIKKIINASVLAFCLVGVFFYLIVLTGEAFCQEKKKSNWLNQFSQQTKSLMENSRQQFKSFSQQANRAIEDSGRQLRRNVDSWQKQNASKMNNSFSQTNQVFQKSMKQTQHRWENEWQQTRERVLRQKDHAAQELQQAKENVSAAWGKYSSPAASELYQAYKQCKPDIVNKCSEVYQRWGESAGAKLSEIYRKYNKSVGDRLYSTLNNYSVQARSDILEGYRRWGGEVGDSIKRTYDRYGDSVGLTLLTVHKQYGSVVGTEIKAAYDQWGPVIGAHILHVYNTYGTYLGGKLHEIYLDYNTLVGEKIRKEYLPKIVKGIANERNQVLAIKATSAVLNLYKNRKTIVYDYLKTFAETPINTKYGKISLTDVSRYWIHKHVPFLIGTDIEKDPAKVVTYCFIFQDKKAIFDDLKIIPNQNGQAVSISTKLEEVAGADIDATIEILDLMEDIESIGEGDFDTETVDTILTKSKRVQQTLQKLNYPKNTVKS
ncbi:MAG: hypothetical protein QG657_1988 [Acidobacteriota bacterium]|nr:hypothetical protein [Acidobacteriota bacterium]